MPSVDCRVRAVRTIERASQAGDIHCPTPATDPLVGVEIRQVVCLGRQLHQRLKRPFRIENWFSIPLETHTWYALQRGPVLEVLCHFEHRVFTLPANDGVHKIRFESLQRQQRRMPAPEDDGKVLVPGFDGAGNFHRLSNHGPGHQRNSETKGILDFLQNALLEVRCDRGVNNDDLISGTNERCRDRQQTQRRSRFGARKSRKEKYDLL